MGKDETFLQLWDCLPDASGQQWEVVEVLAPQETETAVAISSYQSGACLDLPDNAGGEGATVQLWYCNPEFAEAAQQWYFRDGQITHIDSSGEEYCLEAADHEKNGEGLQLWSCSDTKKQRFEYEGGFIKTADGSKCLEMHDDEEGPRVELWDCNSDPSQQ